MPGAIHTRPRIVEDWSNWSGRSLRTHDRIYNYEFVGSKWTGLHHSKDADPLEDCGVVNCVLRLGEKWLSRAYRVQQILVDHCEFLDVLHEHGIYWNVAGGTPTNTRGSSIAIKISNTAFRNISSQAVQMVSAWGREDETVDPDADKQEGLGVKLESVYAENIGASTGNHRSSFAFSFFPMPNDVWLQSVYLENGMQRYSRGGFLCQKRHTTRSRFRIENSYFNVGDLEQPMGKIEDTKDVALIGSEFRARGGQRWIDISGCDRLRIQGCGGNVSVRRDGVNLGVIGSLDIDE